MDLHLQNRTIVITGAASGIGRAVATLAAREGANLALLDQSDTVDQVARKLAGQFSDQHIAAARIDVTDLPQLEQTRDRLLDDDHRIEHVVHCAAIGSGRFGMPFTNLQPDDWNRVLEVNIRGMVNVAHTFAPALQQRGQGSMQFLGSVAGQIGSPTDPPYSASKAAGINFAQCLARDLAPHGIRVNTVCPGMVKTPLNRSVWQAWNEQQEPSRQLSYDEWAQQKIRQLVPMGRWQTPEEVAATILFLLSPHAASITGQTINVDGGYVMHW